MGVEDVRSNSHRETARVVVWWYWSGCGVVVLEWLWCDGIGEVLVWLWCGVVVLEWLWCGGISVVW